MSFRKCDKCVYKDKLIRVYKDKLSNNMENIIQNLILENSAETTTNTVIHNHLIRRSKRQNQKKKFITSFIDGILQNRSVVKIRNYHNIILMYNGDTFQSHFRMSRNCVESLIVELNHLITPGQRRPRIDNKMAILMTLWILGNPTCYRDLSDRFGVSIGCAAGTVLSMCKTLSKLSNKYIKWPNGDEAIRVVQKFDQLRGPNSFPNVIGCIDGMHLPIPAPSDDASSYYNRKGRHSLILQAICDSELKFIDIFFGWPGRSHDASVWRNSAIHKKFENREINLPTNCHLLGDSAYPLATYLMVPFRDNGYLSKKQKKFNTKLSSTRTIIEQSFGLLKCRFRRLKFLNVLNLLNAKYFVVAAIVLHNIIIGFDNDIENYLQSYNNDKAKKNDDNTEDENASANELPKNASKAAKLKRDYICESF